MAMTLEQRRAIAIASARLRLQEQGPEQTDQSPSQADMASVATEPEAIAGLASVRGLVGTAAPIFAGAQVLQKAPMLPGLFSFIN